MKLDEILKIICNVTVNFKISSDSQIRLLESEDDKLCCDISCRNANYSLERLTGKKEHRVKGKKKYIYVRIVYFIPIETL